MSSLTTFAAHCRQMATAEHKPECPSLPTKLPYWQRWHGVYEEGKFVALGWNGPPPPVPTCDGCNPATDRALFALLAAEVDDYLAPTEDLFGDLGHEPTATDCESERP